MKYDTKAELITLVDSLFYENTGQEVSGADANEVAIALLDSLAIKSTPVQYHELNIMLQDLDANNLVEIEHTLNTVNLKVVLYNPEGKRVYSTHFDFHPVDADTVRFTFYSGIPYKRSYKGYIYTAA